MIPSEVSAHKPPGSIAYWIYNYRPRWEAASKEVASLLSAFESTYTTYLLDLSTKSWQPRIFSRRKCLPIAYSLAALPLVGSYSSRFTINHLFASAAAPFLTSRLHKKNSLLTITKATPLLSSLEKNVQHLRQFRFVIVECERHRELLRQVGVDEARIRLIYPGAEIKPYHEAHGSFKILFATSPLSRHDMLSRGVRMMVQAARRLPQAEFVLIWRETVVQDLNALIQEAGVANVRVVNGYVRDMDKYYDEVHATILPGLDHSSLKPCPHSFLESIGHGKPVLVSEPTSVAGIVAKTGCGVVFEPTIDGLTNAVNRLQENYEVCRSRCHPVVERLFSPQVFVEKHRQLYEAMSQRPP
jgi:glycosyltransferase involved in cell wall biosynthesis